MLDLLILAVQIPLILWEVFVAPIQLDSTHSIPSGRYLSLNLGDYPQSPPGRPVSNLDPSTMFGFGIGKIVDRHRYNLELNFTLQGLVKTPGVKNRFGLASYHYAVLQGSRGQDYSTYWSIGAESGFAHLKNMISTLTLVRSWNIEKKS